MKTSFLMLLFGLCLLNLGCSTKSANQSASNKESTPLVTNYNNAENNNTAISDSTNANTVPLNHEDENTKQLGIIPPKCSMPQKPNPIPIDKMRPLILTVETYQNNVAVPFWVSSNLVVDTKKRIERVGATEYTFDDPITKNYPIHIELDCDEDGLYEDIYENDDVSDHLIQCVFKKKGKHQIKMRGEVPHLKLAYTYSDDECDTYDLNYAHFDLISLDQWGEIRWKSMEAFLGDEARTTKLAINATDTPDLTDVCSMEGMFVGVQKFNPSLETWDTSHVENMDRLFTNCPHFDQSLDKWNISALRSAKEIFSEQYSKDVCPKCDAFRHKLYQESVKRPKAFPLALDKNLFDDAHEINEKSEL